MRGKSIVSVIRHYRKSREEALEGGGYRLTALGAWAASRAPHVFAFFRQIPLDRFHLFIDLGSGNGLVTCIAGLFTRAVGIEVDAELCRSARQSALELGIQESVDFLCGDYLSMDIGNADCLYVYPDKPLDRIEEVLAGWNGTLLVYGPHFPPRRLEPVRQLRCGRERLTIYRRT